MHFRPFPVFLAYVFLSGKSADPNPPPLLVENSTIFFSLKPSLTMFCLPDKSSMKGLAIEFKLAFLYYW